MNFVNVCREKALMISARAQDRAFRMAAAASAGLIVSGYNALALDLPFIQAFQELRDQVVGPVAIVLGTLAFAYICFGFLTGEASRAVRNVVGFIIFITCIFWAPDAIEWLQETVGG